ncbi:tetratricopeptide repeat protein [Streptomyces muensis]|uniref:Tetratricopeptide repeat protein n=1 Tax=Streptomyces muensis TaxID=1077944 RepID=A0A9X1PXZ9_STRM4|nr:tetratricopeptide repeat protein [Streptomyces muensis]MCF1594560.1 tetratricopeptide repeat protein [Streptomyces muensis]
MTNYASDSVPSWAGHAWVIWPTFAALALLSIGLTWFSTRQDGESSSPSTLTPVRPLAAVSPASLRPPHIEAELMHGRQAELDRLTHMLRTPNGRFAVICAGGGMGKTTVAAMLCAKAAEAGYDAYWVRWQGLESLQAQLTQVALDCGLPPALLERARAGHDSLPDVFWLHLARTRKWLLVIDNIDDPSPIVPATEQLSDYRGWVRPYGAGLLLLTSRDTSQDVWGSAAELLRLRPLTTTAGGQVLLDLAPQSGTLSEAESLAVRLGGLPLALRAAGRYLTETTSRYRTFTAYQQALEQDLSPLLGPEQPDATDPEVARDVVRHTWEISLDQLAGDRRPLARPVLRLLSLFADAPIPRDLVLGGFVQAVIGETVTEGALDDALSGLRRYDLLQATETAHGGDASFPCLVLHPLVREVNVYILSTTTADVPGWRRKVALHLISWTRELSEVSQSSWDRARLIAPHFALVAELGADGSIPLPNALDALENLAALLSDAGAHPLQLTLRRSAHDIARQILGADHPDTLECLSKYARALRATGDYSAAIDRHREVLAVRTRVLGPRHLDTVSSGHHLARALRYMGRHAESVDLAMGTTSALTNALGPDHPETLASRDVLALALDSLGNHREAAEIHTAVAEIRTRVLGPTHPRTISSLNHLADSLNRLGEHTRAARLARETVRTAHHALGPDHPRTLNGRHALATALHGLGEFAEAARIHRDVLQARTRILDAEHPEAIESRDALERSLAALRGARR